MTHVEESPYIKRYAVTQHVELMTDTLSVTVERQRPRNACDLTFVIANKRQEITVGGAIVVKAVNLITLSKNRNLVIC